MTDVDTIKALVPDSRGALGDSVERLVEMALIYHDRRRALDALALFDACADVRASAAWAGRARRARDTATLYRISVAPETSAPDPSRGRAPGYWFSGFLWGAAVAGAVGILW